METFDYVIVGAGSAGSVLASRLSEDPNVTVCVLEAGPWDWHPFIHIPAGFMYTLVNPRVNWLYTSEASEWTGGRRIAAPRGKTLGGSSSINGHIYNRGQRMDFDGWAQRGNHGWGYADVLPYFRRTERRVGERRRDLPRPRRQPADHRPRLARSDLRRLHRGRGADGHPAQPRLQRHDAGGRQLRAAHHPERPAHQRGARLPASGDEARKNLTVRTHAHATGIVLEGKRAVGIRYRKGGRDGAPMEVRAAKEVILCGGTVNSPQLLQVSGIGPAPLLQSLGIEVRHALPGVGENLRDHYAPRFVARVKNAETINEKSHGLKLVGEVLKYAIARKGILSLNPDPGLRVLEIRRARSTTTTCSSPSRRPATRKACSRPSTISPA